MQRSPRSAGLALTLIVGAEATALASLVALGQASWIPGPHRLLAAEPDEAAFGAVWLVATALAGWLLLTTSAAVVARISRIPSAIRATEWLAIAPVRRLARQITAVSMATSSLAAPTMAVASEAPPIPVVVVVESVEVAEEPVSPSTVPIRPPMAFPDTIVRETPTAHTPVRAEPLMTVTASVAHRQSPTTYTVRPGDNMWTITADYLTEQLGERPDSATISSTWRSVMDLNRDTVRSGDVDLIFPGEQIELPAIGG